MAVTPEAVKAAFPDLEVDEVPLGSGTFKVAFRVRQDGTALVLKVVKSPVDDSEALLPERLRREIEAMRAISSPHIVEVVDGPSVRECGGEHHVWYLEPFYSNGTMDARLESPWGEADVLSLGEQLLLGVEALWVQGKLVHRDIKPANVAFADDGRVVLLDLGIALHIDLTPLTNEFGASPRTPSYAAPEQFDVRRDADIDFRTDLFLVGVVTFQALTGVHPFRPFDQPNEYYERLMKGEYDEDALSAADASQGLQDVLSRMLGAKPNQRYRKIEYALRAVREIER